MTFSDLDKAELALGKPVTAMSDSELVSYLKLAVRHHQDIELSIDGMPERVAADAVLHQYAALAINGEPTLAKGTTEMDGKPVRHRAGEEYSGVVLGPSLVPDFVWVRWGPPEADTHLGLHRLTDLEET